MFYGKVKLKLFYLPKSISVKVSMHSVFHQANKTYQTSNYYNYKQPYKYMCVLEMFKKINQYITKLSAQTIFYFFYL